MINTTNNPEGARIVIVTGATGAIGKAIARQIAAAPGYNVVLIGRDERRTHQATQEIIRSTGNENVRYEIVDLSRRGEIEALVGRWSGPLHVLVNNAGATPRKRLETPEGIEMQWATNVLGYFWLTLAFQELLIQAAPARVVNVASYWAGNLDLADPEFKRRRYDNGLAYRQSKQANRMLTVAFADRLRPHDVTVNVCHPGDVNSKLSNDLGFGGSESPDQGARTPVWLAVDPAVEGQTGLYYEHLRVTTDRFAQDKATLEVLYELCLSYGSPAGSG
ncbi:MAG TPA: SDR family NAD(P)-dependent oxidoreductase [Anaerolineae bacterium]|nr:SDR family NAD(P)-dependent oxidoreductase [Anaerolineae bacterium]